MREIVATFQREERGWSVVVDAAAEFYAGIGLTPESAFKRAMIDVRSHPSFPKEAE